MSNITLNTVRYYTGDDPYHYTVDNRPLQDLNSNDQILLSAIQNLTNIVGTGLYVETFQSGTDFTPGTSTTLNLTSAPASTTGVWIFFDGIYQDANTYYIVNSTITFSSAIPVGTAGIEVKWMTAVGTGGGGGGGGSGPVNFISTVAALRNFSRGTATSVLVLSRVSLGDGQGDVYYYDANDATTPDNGATCVRSFDGSCWKSSFLNPISPVSAAPLTGNETTFLIQNGKRVAATTAGFATMVQSSLAPQRQNFIATAGQTTYVTQGYTPGLVNVFVAGIRLDPTQYTATDGTNVIITDPAVLSLLVAGIVVSIDSILSLAVSDAVTIAYLNAQLAPLQATRTVQTLTATTAGQTTFATTGYQVGLMNLYMSGVRLVNNVDYTATDGTNIILSAGAAALVAPGTVLVAEMLMSYAVANAIQGTSLAASTGSSLVGYTQGSTNAVPRTVQSKLQDVISIKDFGAKGDGVTNDDVAMTNWLAALTTGSCGYIPAGTYIFTNPKIAPLLNNISLKGDGSRSTVFLYNGTNLTSDLITVGNGTTSLTGWSFSGFRVDSAVVLTGGAGLRVRRMQNSSNFFDVDAGLLSGPRNLWDGIWLDNVNVCRYTYGNFSVQNGGLKMNGSASNDEGSDIYLDNLAATYCGIGYWVGGGQGGVYFGKTLAFGNGTNYQIDNGLAARKNREMLFSSHCISDGCTNYGIYVNDTLTSNAPMSIDAFVGSAGLIGSGGAGINIYIKSWPNGRITMGPGQLFNAVSHGLEIDDVSCYVDIDPARHIFNNGGWGIYAPTFTNLINFTGRAWQNTLGNFSPNSNIGVWTSWTPTFGSASGSLTSVTGYGRYKQNGKTVHFIAVASITTNGTAAGSITISLPFASYNYAVVVGRENASTGKMLQGLLSAGQALVSITNYDNTYPGGNGYQLIVSGTYETQ